jgi:hypothetical protein
MPPGERARINGRRAVLKAIPSWTPRLPPPSVASIVMTTCADLVQLYARENGKPALAATASHERVVRLPSFDLELDPSGPWVSAQPRSR